MRNYGLDQSYGQLLASGCDQRLIVGDDGLNAYGTSVLTRRAIALGSCSCSSPSERATRAARQALDQLRGSSHPERTFAGLQSRIRRTLYQTLRLASSTDIALTPSGTDLEMLAAALVAGPGERELVNIVVGRGEVGSGTCNAAAIRHYNTRLPRGGSSIVGQEVDQSLAARTTTKVIDVRDRYGNVLLPLEIDGEVMDTVVAAVDRGARVLLHHVAHSKTGIHAPSLSLLDRVTQTMGEDVVVIVDAAQGRLADGAYDTAVSRGWMVSFTGSKFFGGPPFSGSLFVPPRLRPAATGLSYLPDGFDDYFSHRDLPESWFGVRAANDWTNFGAVLRWTGAAAEIESFFRVDRELREQVAGVFASAVNETFGDAQTVSILPPFLRHDHDSAFDEICNSPTVFCLEITAPNGTSLGRRDLQRLHRHLNKVTGGLGFHLGQPVKIGEDRCVIRIALGAPLIVDVATDSALGETFTQRTGMIRQVIRRLGDRIESFVTQPESVASQ